MPHLHLPIEHTDADLVLAANLAEIVGSEDLYVGLDADGRPTRYVLDLELLHLDWPKPPKKETA